MTDNVVNPIVLIRTGQNGYSPSQVADRAMTVAELIQDLEQYDPHSKVVVGGYGRGAVYEPARLVEDVWPLEEDEDAPEFPDFS